MSDTFYIVFKSPNAFGHEITSLAKVILKIGCKLCSTLASKRALSFSLDYENLLLEVLFPFERALV